MAAAIYQRAAPVAEAPAAKPQQTQAAAAKARNADVLLVDTAGRLHNKKNLMNELGKINKILESEYPHA